METEEKRVIDVNELMERRLRDLAARAQQQEAAEEGSAGEDMGFAPLGGEAIFVSGDGEEGELSGNVIKAQPAADPEGAPQEEQVSPEELLEQARAQAAEILAEARAEAEQTKKAAHDNGYREGHEEGLKKALREQEEGKAQLAREREELDQQYRQLFSEMEPQLVDAITGIYEHIFRVDLKMHREILLHLIQNTLKNIDGSRSFLIHVSQEYYDFVTSRKAVLEEAVALPNSVMEIVEDTALTGTSCMIETDGGIFDCSLGTEMSELSQKLRMLSYTK